MLTTSIAHARSTSYRDNLKELGSFSTLEDFWRCVCELGVMGVVHGAHALATRSACTPRAGTMCTSSARLNCRRT